MFAAVKQKRAVLIHGPSGCGKTALAEAFLRGQTRLSYAAVPIPSLFSGAFGEGEQRLRGLRDRGVVLLENGEVLGNDEVSRRLVTAICDLSESTSVIVTTSDLDSFPTILRQSSRIADAIEIESPSPDDRFRILSHFCGDDFAVADIREAANSATGFVGGDLQRLVSEAIVSNTSLTESLSRVKPASLRHISLEIPEVHWDDIGGYDTVKQKLRESVTLPLERPECFIRLGIRPPRGVLLYGPPGCSKTLMAKAVATESRMNFIAVKGPELFSKFVGESEKAVASVF
jgi:AAA family ATPase